MRAAPNGCTVGAAGCWAREGVAGDSDGVSIPIVADDDAADGVVAESVVADGCRVGEVRHRVLVG